MEENKNQFSASSERPSELNSMFSHSSSPESRREVSELKNEPSVLAYPVNFRQTNVEDIGGGVLQFKYEWDSSTGNLEHLSHITLGEYVAYPGAMPDYQPNDDPPCHDWHFPNPTILEGPATGGKATDTHSPAGGFCGPYKNTNFMATQKYRYRAAYMPEGEYIPIQENIAITRSVSMGPSGWIYSITKSGASAVLSLPSSYIPHSLASKMETTTNLVHILNEIKNLKVGTTRSNFLKLFVPMGGLSFPTEASVFWYRKNHLVKIKVRFDFIDKDKESWNPDDKISEISEPYIDSHTYCD